MKRSVKNILCSVLTAVMAGLLVVTVLFSGETGAKNEMTEMGGMNDMKMPEIDDEAMEEMNEKFEKSDSEIPEKPDGMNSEGRKGQGDDENEPPEKPDGNGKEVPSMPNGENDDEMLEINTEMMKDFGTKNTSTNWLVIVAIVFESLILAATSIFMIMSRGNKFGIKETFKTKEKIIIAILAEILIADFALGGFC